MGTRGYGYNHICVCIDTIMGSQISIYYTCLATCPVPVTGFIHGYPCRHGNGAGVGMGFAFPSLPPTPIYLPVTLSIPNGDEKLNLIPVPNGFGYSSLIPVPAVNQFFIKKIVF